MGYVKWLLNLLRNWEYEKTKGESRPYSRVSRLKHGSHNLTRKRQIIDKMQGEAVRSLEWLQNFLIFIRYSILSVVLGYVFVRL